MWMAEKWESDARPAHLKQQAQIILKEGERAMKGKKMEKKENQLQILGLTVAFLATSWGSG